MFDPEFSTMPDQPNPLATPSSQDRDRHVTEPEIHQDLLDPDGAAEAGTPGRDENAPGFIKPAAT
jgi:hypothetical protein